MRTAATLLATWFGVGSVRKGPGTAGSAAALVLAYAIHWLRWQPPANYALLALIFLWPAIWAADRYAKLRNKKDPQDVVIDEVIGQWITLAGATSLHGWKVWLLAFLLFRAFDILKPPPVRQFEKLPGGVGIVMDDVMAGVYGAVVLRILGWNNLY